MAAEKEPDNAFVDGWIVGQILGEGAFGEVRLLVHSETGREVAMKVINLAQDTSGLTKREVMILKMLKHNNVIGFIGQRITEHYHYIFLEYAAGGELFDRIEPDVGMSEEQAQFYFRQLINGVEYLHGIGIAHRDLKPENLLLTENDVLKISDFGLATVFRMKGAERKLNKRCGTLVYVAPEVLQGEYDAAPADVWSCGVVLVALLTGELPWDSPSADCQNFVDWKECRSWRQAPWSKMHNVALSLLRCILHCQPDRRATIDRIKAHQWFMKDFTKRASSRACVPAAKRLCFMVDKHEITQLSQPECSSKHIDGLMATQRSQEPASSACALARSTTNRDYRIPLTTADANGTNTGSFSFSQPAVLENLFIATQSQPSQQSQQSQQTMLQRLVRRMTRFVVTLSVTGALVEVETVCCSVLKFSVKQSTSLQLTISTIDCRRMPLVFKATAYGLSGKTLLDFRLSKGDGLEFKRSFVRIRQLLMTIIDKEALNSWANPAVSTTG